MDLRRILGGRHKDVVQVNPSTRTLEQVDFACFLEFATENISDLRTFLGDEQFGALRVIDRKIPSAGEIVLSQTHGLRLEMIARNLQKFVERLDTEISPVVEKSLSKENSTVWLFIQRMDNIADMGVLVGHQADEAVHNLSEYHLSLINYLRNSLPEEAVDKLVKRFAARNALRGDRLVQYWAINQDNA